MMQEQIQAYIVHVRQIPPLLEDDERGLVARARIDDPIAQLDLAEANLLLAAKIAAEYSVRKGYRNFRVGFGASVRL
jgi:DNA-directed RNA polymerase sigma subunit (sigma70/sigma32)